MSWGQQGARGCKCKFGGSESRGLRFQGCQGFRVEVFLFSGWRRQCRTSVTRPETRNPKLIRNPKPGSIGRSPGKNLPHPKYPKSLYACISLGEGGGCGCGGLCELEEEKMQGRRSECPARMCRTAGAHRDCPMTPEPIGVASDCCTNQDSEPFPSERGWRVPYVHRPGLYPSTF